MVDCWSGYGFRWVVGSAWPVVGCVRRNVLMARCVWLFSGWCAVGLCGRLLCVWCVAVVVCRFRGGRGLWGLVSRGLCACVWGLLVAAGSLRFWAAWGGAHRLVECLFRCARCGVAWLVLPVRGEFSAGGVAGPVCTGSPSCPGMALCASLVLLVGVVSRSPWQGLVWVLVVSFALVGVWCRPFLVGESFAALGVGLGVSLRVCGRWLVLGVGPRHSWRRAWQALRVGWPAGPGMAGCLWCLAPSRQSWRRVLGAVARLSSVGSVVGVDG